MIPGKVHSVIFDFDYTLGDSSPGIIESVNYALSRLGLPQASPEAIRRTIGLSLTETFKALTGPEQAHLGDAFQDHFVVRADEVMADSTKLFDFVPATVRTLSDRGLKLGIVSSKYRRRIEGVLEREGLREHFAVIVGAEDVAAFKPDPAGLISAAEKLSTSPANVLYVGDSLTDAETARRASVPFVAVLSGVTERHEFAECPVHHVLGSIGELPAILPRVL
ncbi:MAG: HAD family hydrolase [Chloroflexi bacterium]|nr:HAD family hydrolase [Chloroflexota bacterium]